MAKQIRREPFSAPHKKEALCLSLDIVSDWLGRKQNPLSANAHDLSVAFRAAENPVRVLLRSEAKRDSLTDVMLAVGEIKNRPEGDADRNFKPLRMANRRILQLCEDVLTDGGSFNCARPKISFACLPLPGCAND